MPELKESKPFKGGTVEGASGQAGKVPLLPLVRVSPSGFFILVIIAVAFCTGSIRQELVLSLVGAILLAVWLYCFILGFMSALIHRNRASRMRVELSPRNISTGMAAETLYKEDSRFLRIPGILCRCRLCLETKDGRRVEHIFDPGLPADPLTVPLRGAYYSKEDEMRVVDAFHICAFSWSLHREVEARLLVSPRPAEERVPVSPRSGGRERRSGVHYLRNDDLIDHRPYIPGDDPRRINWKLYSHGPANALFVREGEPEPPPYSQVLILTDTETDGALYEPAAGREAVDLLCVQALTIALDLAGRGMDVLTGYTGGKIQDGDLVQAMAWPASLPLPGPAGKGQRPGKDRSLGRETGGALPELPSLDRGTCILALPRTSGGTGALDRFLNRRPSPPLPCDIIFLYTENGPDQIREAAETCARLYGARNAVHAQALAVPEPRVTGASTAPTPVTATPATGTPATGTPATGTPAAGTPAAGTPMP
ncbi:MAG: DUF58 domain-containing protein [Treponema sp.]|nr:DUF58 domain-containing protein [Treponema sp.]